MAPPPCGPASRSLALLLLACTSCALLLALRRCSGGAPGACPKPQLATVNGALQLLARRSPVDEWRPWFVPDNATGGPIQPALLRAAQVAANEGGSVMLTITNTPGMLGQTPVFLGSLKAQPDDPSRHLIVVAFDEPAALLCARHHPAELCVLDDWNTTRLTIEDPEKLQDFAAWGGPQFRAMMWRKMELVNEIMLQGYSVLCTDTDIALFRNPLDPQVNPLMRADIDLWTSIDGGAGMANCGFFWIQCSPRGLAFMEQWLAAAYAADSLMDVWEQMVFGTLIFTKPPTISFAPLDERYFGEMCFYSDAHDALLRNKGALLDPHAFGEAFDASLEAMDAWQTMFGWHFPCCIDQPGGRLQHTPHGDAECKAIASSMALLRWQAHEAPWTGSTAVTDLQRGGSDGPPTGSGSSQVLPASGTTSIADLRKQFYRTTGQYARHQGKLLRKVAPEYYQSMEDDRPAPEKEPRNTPVAQQPARDATAARASSSAGKAEGDKDVDT